MAAKRKFVVATVACVAVVAGLSGCSSEDDAFDGMSADDIAKKSFKTSKAADSFKVTGEGKQQGSTVRLSFAINKEGACEGNMSAGKQGKAELLVIDKATYLKGDDAYWKSTMSASGAAVNKKLDGRWVKSPSGGSGSGGSVCDRDDLFKAADAKDMERGDDADVDGQKAATLVKKESGGKTSTFYVATEGKPYLLQVETKGKEQGTTTFSDYNKPVKVKAPAADQVADVKEIVPGS
ncbi:hypothetical protein DSC45_16220 [Streptomyces sp. YIM 130001]|uniref:hypothetical protein n=1 Tax=Streptomyces sp. YIM 130001 TaxID=2259644 RepID=UPI000E65DACA|nr:hypothetical protein [Streptomyces sp. YIM 130001]RII16133.1 hypothetical protein DSC45_16220 [Streptomyces sp. YIM 130001]